MIGAFERETLGVANEVVGWPFETAATSLELHFAELKLKSLDFKVETACTEFDVSCFSELCELLTCGEVTWGRGALIGEVSVVPRGLRCVGEMTERRSCVPSSEDGDGCGGA